MPIQQGMSAVDAILTSPNWDIQRLILAARERAQQMGTGPGLSPGNTFGLNSCGTWYGTYPQGSSHELISWCLSLLLAEYTAGLLAQKAREGHCQIHRTEPALIPCHIMAPEHMRMLGVFKDALKSLVAEIEQLEQQTPVPQPQPHELHAWQIEWQQLLTWLMMWQ